DAFFAARFDRALALRERIRPDPERKRAARLVHGEADFLPGLVVDRYADCVSLQTLTEATDKRKGLFIDLIKAKLSPRAIVERNDPKVRQHEGLEQKKGLLHGALDGPVPYLEGEVTLNADLLEGQKTGAFLDQSENRIEAGRHAYGRALDCFTYGGGFALQLAQHASNVTAVDISEKACADARLAAQRNPEIAAKVFFTCANAFDFLKDQAEAGERYDTIVLDPPAFSKRKAAIDAAVRGYKEINLRAFQMLSAGGVLVTASCSFHVDDVLFERTVLSAAVDAGKSVQIVERRGAGRDHPTLLGMPESRYIKCLVLRVG
ncbi:MAG: class I SAM-dependent rRNA methyltransferase, partial [Deltaproteobacteria bacterium]|nr:class I SAM-dependent rRNA methyltransferase [Deltaproteobacteria bacterium]